MHTPLRHDTLKTLTILYEHSKSLMDQLHDLQHGGGILAICFSKRPNLTRQLLLAIARIL